jgi:hypothetical protein
MTDLELLRAELRERETLAPDPNVVLTRTHAVLRRRRKARLAGGLVAVAAATAGVLVAGTAFLQTSAPAPVPGAGREAPAALVSPAATLPFTIGHLPVGYVIDTWRLTPGDLAVDLVGPGRTGAISVHIQDRDPAAGGDGEPRTVNGVPAVLRLVQSSRELSWQLAPGKWAIISGHKDYVAVDVLQAMADSMTPVPAPVGPSLREISAPPGLDVVFASGGSPEDQAVTFCSVATMDPDTPGCVNIQVHVGTLPSSLSMPIFGKKQLREVPLVALAGSPLKVSADGRAAGRQVDAGHWLAVTSPDVDSTILRTVASSGVFG